MPAFEYFSAELLQPISGEQPCGVDLRYHPLFTEIAEARRFDEELNEGEWQKEGGRKVAEWNVVAELCIGALRDRSKDLRIAVYLTEAALRLDGFVGLRDCLRLITELLRLFWDQGLFPAIDDGDLEYRASALAWLNDRMPVLVNQVPITARTGGQNFGFVRYQQAQRVGSEAAIASASAEKRATVEGWIKQGWITMDRFNEALRATELKELEAIYRPFDEAERALHELERVADEKFGELAPTFSAAKEAFTSIRKVLAPAIKNKGENLDRKAGSPSNPRQVIPPPEGDPRHRLAAIGTGVISEAGGGRWEEAESLLRENKVDQALAQMAALAAQEPSGRGRFMRKLTLSDVCLANGRNRLARTLLDELKQQIEEFKLDQWESSALVGAVWSRLYKLCRKSDNDADKQQAAALYNQLCHLDPWQAYLSCED